MGIYHYKSNNGEWIPFTLLEDDGDIWVSFCRYLSHTRQDNPFPQYYDYVYFIMHLIGR